MGKQAKQRIIALCLSIALLIGMVPMNAFAIDDLSGESDIPIVPIVESNDIWDGSVASGFARGTGTESDPYIIETAEQLAYLSSSVNGDGKTLGSGNTYAGKFIKLANDIYLNDTTNWENWDKTAPANTWTAIGTDDPLYYNSYIPFCGIFDGDGHTVSGLYINNTEENQGLFGLIYNAILKNIDINESYIKGGSKVGGIVGYSDLNCVVENCTNSGSITGEGDVDVSVGGIIGHNIGKVINCTNTGLIKAVCTDGYSSANAGGIVGDNDGLYSESKREYYYGTITLSVNKGNVSGTGLGTSRNYWGADVNVGGISGISSGGLINKCSNFGEVKGSGHDHVRVGGLIGNTYDWTMEYNGYESCNGNVENCYNTGNLFGESKEVYSKIYIAGLVGAGIKTIETSYNAGAIETKRDFEESSIFISEICAYSDIVDNCYYLENTIKDKHEWVECGTALTDEQMKQKEFFAGFDFERNWEIGIASGYDYPTIKFYPDFEYILKDGKIIIIKYNGTDKDVKIPDIISGYPVVAIAEGAFADCDGIESVFIPTSVVAIDSTAFDNTNIIIRCHEGSYADEYVKQTGMEADIIKHSHSYKAETVNPTCTDGGYTVYTCNGCGDTYTDDETEPLGHHYVVDSYVAETADEPCHTVYKCDRDGCGDTYKKYEEKPKRTPTLNGQIKTREITNPEEMKKCGIDINAPDNNIVFEFEAVYTYEGPSGGSSQPKSLTIYTNSKGKIVGYGGYSGYIRLYDNDSGYGYGGGGGGGSAGTSLSGSVWYYDPDTDTAIQPLGTNGDPDNPSYYYLRLNGYGGILKQMFEVTLEVQNSSDELWYEECKAEIILPDGLSLATMYDSGTNKAIQSINDDGVVEKNGSGSATWYVRGDKAGIFDIEAKVSGKIYPEPTDDFEMLFKTNEPIVIDDVKDCIQLDIYNVPQIIKNGQTAEIEVRLTNISNRVLNHVVLGIIGGEEIVVDCLKPGEPTSATRKVTFNLSSSSKEEIEYHLINKTFVCNLDFPFGGVHFAQTSGNGEITVDVTAWEEYSEQNNQWQYEVEDYDYALGSFSWQKQSLKSDLLIDKTNFDKLCLKVEVKHVGDGTDNSKVTGAKVLLNAPDGFSFSTSSLQKEYNLTVENLNVGQSKLYAIEIYPIYSLDYADGQQVRIMATVTDSIYEDNINEVSIGNIHRLASEGKVSVADSAQEYNVQLTPDMFKNSPYMYSQELARIGIALSSLQYCSNEQIEESFRNLGFSNIQIYDNNSGIDTINYSFATKRIIIEDKVYTMLFVPMRGTVDLAEWAGNLAFSKYDGDHIGFKDATIDIEAKFMLYYSSISSRLTSDLKLFLTGHSRGAAVANLFGADVDNGDFAPVITADNTYIYTFATPNTTDKENVSAELYRNIFNIIDYNDIVSMVPPRYILNYNKYGLTFSFSADYAHHNYDEIILNRVRSLYYHYLQTEYNTLTEAQRITFACNILPAVVGVYTSPYIAIKYLFFADIVVSSGDIIPDVIATHHPVNYLSWMDTLDELSQMQLSAINFKIVEVQCPVDVIIRDSKGNIVGRTIGGVVDETASNNSVVLLAVENDYKLFLLPDNDTYTFKAIGYDEGIMDITIIEYSDYEKVRVINFKDVPISTEKWYEMDVDNSNDVASQYELVSNEGQTLTPTKIYNNEQLDDNTVAVTVSGRGSVEGSGKYTSGEIVILKSICEHSEFIGWYLGDQLLSTEKTYCFVCNADIELEARFENIPYPTVNGTIESFGDTDGEITVSLLAGGIVIDKVTVTDGTYSFEIPVNGTYTVEFAKENHATRQYEVTVDDADVTQNAKIHLMGDINGDGKVNITDVNKANAHASKTKFLSDYELVCADVTGEGNVNITDVNKINAHASKIKYLW